MTLTIKLFRLAKLAAWISFLVGAIAFLQSLHSSQLGTTELSDLTNNPWSRDANLTVVLVSVAIPVAKLFGLYLLASTALAVLAGLTRNTSLLRMSQGLTLPFIRKMTNGALQVSLAGSLALPGVVFAHVAPSYAQAATSTMNSPTQHDDLPVLRRVNPTVLSQDHETSPPPPATTAAPDQETTYVVQRGDNFWSIAHRKVATYQNSEPRDVDVMTYWKTLVTENRPVLANKSKPSLIFPGQVLKLPKVLLSNPDLPTKP